MITSLISGLPRRDTWTHDPADDEEPFVALAGEDRDAARQRMDGGVRERRVVGRRAGTDTHGRTREVRAEDTPLAHLVVILVVVPHDEACDRVALTQIPRRARER